MDKNRSRSGRDAGRSPEGERDKAAVKVTHDTHKRLKLLAIVEDRSIPDILEELVRERYGKRQKEIETLIKLAGNPTKVI